MVQCVEAKFVDSGV